MPSCCLLPCPPQKLVDRLKRERFTAIFDYLRRGRPAPRLDLLATVQVCCRRCCCCCWTALRCAAPLWVPEPAPGWSDVQLARRYKPQQN